MRQLEMYNRYLVQLNQLHKMKVDPKKLYCIKRIQPGNRPEYFKTHSKGYCFEYAGSTPLFIARKQFIQTVEHTYRHGPFDDYSYDAIPFLQAVEESIKQTQFAIRTLDRLALSENVK